MISEPLTNLTETDSIELCFGEENFAVIEMNEEDQDCLDSGWCSSFEKAESCEQHCHSTTGENL